MESHDESINFPCYECHKDFRKQKHLEAHLSSVHNLKKPSINSEPSICDVCNASFPTHGRLKAHQKAMHMEKRFPCEVCEKTFAWESSVINHMKNVHKKHKPKPDLPKYQCNFCEKRFKIKKRLDEHLVTHTKLKAPTFDCEVCEKKCRRPDTLRRHQKEAHPDHLASGKLKSKEYKCDVCPKVFPGLKNLQSHKKYMHIDRKTRELQIIERQNQKTYKALKITAVTSLKQSFPCGNCNQNFISNIDLARHHHEQRALTLIQCGYCLDTFNHKCHYYSHHRQIHSGDQPLLKCTLCETSVRDYLLLRTHDYKCHQEQTDDNASSSAEIRSTNENDFNGENNTTSGNPF